MFICTKYSQFTKNKINGNCPSFSYSVIYYSTDFPLLHSEQVGVQYLAQGWMDIVAAVGIKHVTLLLYLL